MRAIENPMTMDPTRTTSAELLPIQDELVRREPIFHRPEVGTTRADFEAMTDPAFWEIGASGRCYSREFVLDVLEKRTTEPAEDPWTTEGFYTQEISPGHYLLTYTLYQGERVTRRSTLWRGGTDGWKILFHQGTIVE